ncbi:hypothetical protein BDQ12DRAFT_738263 [Crucibulum laeve]|uniref:P-loop containing nucleoside triphosphate hydrolase protein n=1 Tax=Crucibulum laeve TaxID=68775 RepID=A0A5C3LMK2_9AGAR|nr:hypothetical protein BDQ12DRAFT_738263 [Crucibulum laeve]
MPATSAVHIFTNARGVSIRDTSIYIAGRDQFNIINQAPLQHEPAKTILKPHSSALFTGQQAHLNRLKIYFSLRTENNISPWRSFVIYGMGGIGKTQIALKFAEDVSGYSHIFWVDATDENTISASLKGLSSIPDAKNASVGETTESVLYWC